MSDHDRRPARQVSAQPTASADSRALAQSRRLSRSPSNEPSTQPQNPTPEVAVRIPRLGQYLQNLGFLTAPQLMRALAQQSQRTASGLPIPLGTLLIADGTLTPQDLVMALMMQQLDRVQASAVAPGARLGELLVQGGLVTAAQCASALHTQLRAGRPGMHLRLGQILIAQSLVTPRCLAAVLRAQQAARDSVQTPARTSRSR